MNFNPLKKYKNNILLAILGLVFFVTYSYLNFNNPHLRFSWPDEMATYFTTTTFAETNSFSSPAQHADIAGNLISPRSMMVWQGSLVPVGFLGLPLIYGFVAKAIGAYSIIFLTPLLAVFGAFFLYRLLGLYFKEEIALLSGILLLILPAYSYYASFSMLSNVPQISLLIIGLYFLNLFLRDRKASWHPVISGLLVGMSLIIRPNEIIWIAPLVLFFIFINRKLVSPVSVIRFSLFLFIPIILLGFAQYQTYGHWYSTGYSLPQADAASGNSFSVLNYLFPFGINIVLALKNLTIYVGTTHWLFLGLCGTGVIMTLLRETEKKWRVLLIISLLLWTYLGLMYGSWKLLDNQILEISRLGISYNRYLLPALITSLPFISYLLIRIYRMDRRYAKFSSIAIVVCIFGFWISKVYFQGNDSLPKIKASIAEYNQVFEKVIEATPSDAIIETRRGDKIVFPQRQVVAQYSIESDLGFLDNLHSKTSYYVLANKNSDSWALFEEGFVYSSKYYGEEVFRFGDYKLFKVVPGDKKSEILW